MENRAQFAPPVRTGRHGLLVWVRAAADPVAAVACLIACNLLWGVTFGRSEVVLCVLTFLLLYPNTLAHSSRPRDIARTVLTSWLLAAGALWVFGMVTGMSDADLLAVYDDVARQCGQDVASRLNSTIQRAKSK